MTTDADEVELVRKKRARGAGLAAAILSWMLNDGVLTLLKTVLMEAIEGAGPDAASPSWGLPYDGWWISLIIAAVVGSIVAMNVGDDLRQVRRFINAEEKTNINWWTSFWGPVLGGVAVYHVVWLFHEPTGLVF